MDFFEPERETEPEGQGKPKVQNPLPRTITFNTDYSTMKFLQYGEAVSGSHQISVDFKVSLNEKQKQRILVTRFLFEPELQMTLSDTTDAQDTYGHVNILVAKSDQFGSLNRDFIFNFSKNEEFKTLLIELLKKAKPSGQSNPKEYKSRLEKINKDYETKPELYEFIIVLHDQRLDELEDAILGKIEDSSLHKAKSSSIDKKKNHELRGRSTIVERARTTNIGVREDRSRSRDKRDSTRSRARAISRARSSSRRGGGKTKKNKRITITRKNR